MSAAFVATRRPSSLSDGSSSSRPSDNVLDLEKEEEQQFHECTEIVDTLYLSFDAQDLPPSPLIQHVPAEHSELMEFSDVSEKGPNSRSESEAFYSCEGGRPTIESEAEEEEAVTSDPDTIDQPSPVECPSAKMPEEEKNEEDDDDTRVSGGAKISSVGGDVEMRRRLAFAPHCFESFRTEMLPDRTSSAEDPSDVQSSGTSPRPPCSIADNFGKEDEKLSNTLDQTSTPDVLVTLTSTDMGISAKREDSLDPPALYSKNLDSIPDNTIFDKAQLVEEALDTAEINKCMDTRRAARLNALPSLRIQEQYSDELRSITKNHRHQSSSSSVTQVCPSLPASRLETVSSQSTLARANSAPSDIKEENFMAEDVEISSILGHGICFSAIEDRPSSSLSEPFEEVIQTSQRGCKKYLSSWVQRKMHFVSFDTESEAASVTRSEYIMDLKRGKERQDDDGLSYPHHHPYHRYHHHYHHRSRPSSRFGYVNGFAIGPSVSPVPPGGIQDFSKEDAISLNAALRNNPQLTNVPMGEWTSKLIGFATPADYYVHMIHELSAQKINVLALIKAKLGEHHPLVTDIIEKLRNYTTEVPSFILSSMSKGHKRTPPLASHHRLPLFTRETTDFHQSVEAALIRCGVNMAFFDKSRCKFATEQEYYEYISCQIKSAGFEVSLKKLKELLGAAHPFVNIFRSSVAMDCGSSSRTGSLTDSARSIQSGTSKSSPRRPPPTKPRDAVSTTSQEDSVQVENNVEKDKAWRGPCLLYCFAGLRKTLQNKRSKHRKNHTIA